MAVRSKWFGALALTAALAVACSGQPARDGAVDQQDPVDLVDTTGGTDTEAGPTPDGGEVDAQTPGATPGGATPTGGSPTAATGPAPTKNQGVPEAKLYSGNLATRGMTDSEIRLCAHAGLTLASLFGNDIRHLEQTYWRMVNDEQGGIFGRSVNFRYVDDGYNPNNVPSAFAECQDFAPFFMIGGIGFDQTPSFRQIAEDNKELYIYGMATEKGGRGNTYTYGAAPSVEWLGTLFGRVVMSKLKGKKLGILTVASDGWKGGADAFEAEVKRLGYTGQFRPGQERREIANNNDVLTSHVDALRRADVEAVFLNINVLAWTRFVSEADTQRYYPTMVGFGFNLLTDTVGQTMRRFPTSWGLSPWSVYDPQRKYDWSDEYERMRAAYQKYWNKNDPNDIDWIQWVSMMAFHRLLRDCGKDCNRNKIAGLLMSGYKRTEKPNCRVDFSRGRIGGYLANLWKTIDRGNTQVWREMKSCATTF